MYKVIWSKKFKKDYKKLEKQNLDLSLLDDVILMIAGGNKLDEKYNDHELHGNWEGYRECHIKSDWLLIYKIQNDKLALLLSRTGSHSNLLNM